MKHKNRGAAGAEVLKKIDVKGTLSGTWDVSGCVGTIGADTIAPEWLAVITGDIKSVKVASRAGGSLDANAVKSYTVKGDMEDARLRVRQSPFTAAEALGKLSVSGWLKDSEICSDGNVKSVTAGGLDGARICAGVKEGLSGLATDLSELAVNATITKLTVKGIKDAACSVRGSCLIANELGSIKLVDVDGANGSDPFGIAARIVGSVQYNLRGAPGIKLRSPLVSEQHEDFEIRLL